MARSVGALVGRVTSGGAVAATRVTGAEGVIALVGLDASGLVASGLAVAGVVGCDAAGDVTAGRAVAGSTVGRP